MNTYPSLYTLHCSVRRCGAYSEYSIVHIFSILWLHDVPLIWGAGVVGGHRVKALIKCGTGGSCLGTREGSQPNEAHVGGNFVLAASRHGLGTHCHFLDDESINIVYCHTADKERQGGD